MNIKLISKALHTLSLLSDEDVAIVFGLHSASEDERSVLMLALEPNTKPPQKKSSKKTARVPPDARCIGYPPGSVSICGLLKKDLIHHSRTAAAYHEFIPPQAAGKSRRANGMATQLSSRRQERATTSGCFATVDDNGGEMTCGKPEDDPVHDTTYLTSHPFLRGVLSAVSVSTPANSETQPEDVSNVHHAGG